MSSSERPPMRIAFMDLDPPTSPRSTASRCSDWRDRRATRSRCTPSIASRLSSPRGTSRLSRICPRRVQPLLRRHDQDRRRPRVQARRAGRDACPRAHLRIPAPRRAPQGAHEDRRRGRGVRGLARRQCRSLRLVDRPHPALPRRRRDSRQVALAHLPRRRRDHRGRHRQRDCIGLMVINSALNRSFRLREGGGEGRAPLCVQMPLGRACRPPRFSCLTTTNAIIENRRLPARDKY